MKNINNIVWGLALIAVGVILGANILKIADINLFFSGWWTLFIIIPSFVGLFDDNNKTGNLICLLIGIALLLCAQDLISFELVWKLALPIILIIVGLSFIFKDVLKKETQKKIKQLNKKNTGNNSFAMFSGQKIDYNKKEFKGTNLTTIFGGIECDLTGSLIEEDIVINATSVFGGIDIIVPDTVDVVIKSNSLFGGVDDKRKKKKEEKKSHTIYINAICIFGGVDIK